MQKKYIIAVVAVVVLWGAFMVYRHFKKEEDTRAYREDTYGRMIEMARKSPRAGLYEMAEAIRRYHADFKAYPPSLDALYPKYMPSKAFIEQIAWRYEPAENDFSLSKSVVYNKKTMVASIDNRMRPEVETDGVMVAKRAAPEAPAEVEIEEEVEMPQQAISEDLILEVMAEREMTVKEVDVVAAAVTPEQRREDRAKDAGEEISVQTELSRIVTQVGEEAVSAREAEIGYDLEHYLVWKEPDGALGISNVAFPERGDMYVAVKNRWYNVRRREPERAGETAETLAALVETPETDEEMAAGLSRSYLVWKNADGAIGVGDSQYPDKKPLLIASQKGWNELERPPLAAASADAVAQEAAGSPAQARTIDAIAADISREYLVWKNEDGSIGVGDSVYPERKHLEVASRGEWSTLTAEPPPQTGPRQVSNKAVEAQETLEQRLLAAGGNGQYLMWKDKNGRIGFGNVAYPELRNIAYIQSGGGWQKVVN